MMEEYFSSHACRYVDQSCVELYCMVTIVCVCVSLRFEGGSRVFVVHDNYSCGPYRMAILT